MSLRKWYSNRNRNSDGEGEDDEIEKVFKLLEEGERVIVLDENHKNPIYVLGNTGSGKSTVVQFVATDNKALHSEETYPGSGEFIIVDDNESIGGGITSQTVFPTLVIDEDIQSAFYDCPGFNDTRSPSNEIAASYFNKKVFDFADKLKILLTVNHSSVRPGIERKDFMDLLKHTTNLVKEIDKYASCIAIFVTKVENTYMKDPVEGLILVPDETVIKNVGNYMESVKKEIEKKVPGNNEEAEFHKRAIKLINVFLTTDAAGKFTKIGIFRRPDEAGPLLEVELLQERKPQMKHILYEVSKFIEKNSVDFGHTISDTAKLQVNKMVDRIRVHVATEIDNVVDKLREHDQSIAVQIQDTIKSFTTGSNTVTNEAVARNLTSKLKTSFDAISKLKSDVVKAKVIKEIAAAITACGTALTVDTEVEVKNIMLQDNYFEFLQEVNGGLTIGDFSKSFDGITVSIAATRNVIEKDTENMASSVRERIKVNLNGIIPALDSCYDAKFESLGIEKLITDYGKQHGIVVEFVKMIKTINTAQELSREIKNMVSKSGIESTEINAGSLAVFNYGNYLSVLNIFKSGLNVWSSEWIKMFEVHEENVFKTQKWYSFIQRTYIKLSSFDYLQYSERYNVANIDDWGKEGKPQGIQITKSNYTKFLQKLNEEEEIIKNMVVDERKLRELNHVLELTVKQKIFSRMGGNGELSIQAVFVKFSELVGSNGKLKPELSNGKKVKIVNIFATDTVFVDKDLNAVGEKIQVNVVAPNWEIIGTRDITLNGINAEPLTTVAGKDQDGKPGLPGGSSGHFVGITYIFKAPGNLAIGASGGRGGKGQEGGPGGDGGNGANATNSFTDFKSELIKKDIGGGHGVVIITEKWKFFGNDGKKGNNGGDGGVGGNGGLAGNVTIMRTDGATGVPKTKTDKGANGDGNNGGSGGGGGMKGNDRVQKCTYYSGTDRKWDRNYETITSTDRAANGDSGRRDFNGVGRETPEKLDSTDTDQVSKEYKSSLGELVNDWVLKETLKRFLDKIR